MIETSMYIGIGFLLGLLVGLLFVPLVHNRAVRLTTKRLSIDIPVSAAEIASAKDLMRADFAISMRRLELQIERLRTRHAGHFAELAEKNDEIHQQKVQVAALLVRLAALERQLKAHRDETPLLMKDTSFKGPRTIGELKSKLSRNPPIANVGQEPAFTQDGRDARRELLAQSERRRRLTKNYATRCHRQRTSRLRRRKLYRAENSALCRRLEANQ